MSRYVLLHGWGTHPVIWEPLLEALPGARALPLPGYAGSAPAASISDAAARIAEQLEADTTLVGWSLGGQLALRLALDFPAKSSRLVLIGATPCFVNREDWPHGVEDAVFAQFARSLAEDYAGTLRRFLSLQAQGADEARTVLAELRRRLLAQPWPADGVLEAGLDMLRGTDLRAEVSRLDVPVSLIHGTGDKLAPLAAARWLGAQLPSARLHEIAGAAHAPFLSHPREVAELIAHG